VQLSRIRPEIGRTPSLATIAVVLPAYNEQLTIADTIRSFAAALPDAYIAVVNNNSTDRTAEIAARTLQELSVSGSVLNETRTSTFCATRISPIPRSASTT